MKRKSPPQIWRCLREACAHCWAQRGKNDPRICPTCKRTFIERVSEANDAP